MTPPPAPPSAPVSASPSGPPSVVVTAPVVDAITPNDPAGVDPIAVRLAPTPPGGGLTITCGIDSVSSGPATAAPEASIPNTVATDSAAPVNLKFFPIVMSSPLGLR